MTWEQFATPAGRRESAGPAGRRVLGPLQVEWNLNYTLFREHWSLVTVLVTRGPVRLDFTLRLRHRWS